MRASQRIVKEKFRNQDMHDSYRLESVPADTCAVSNTHSLSIAPTGLPDGCRDIVGVDATVRVGRPRRSRDKSVVDARVRDWSWLEGRGRAPGPRPVPTGWRRRGRQQRDLALAASCQ